MTTSRDDGTRYEINRSVSRRVIGDIEGWKIQRCAITPLPLGVCAQCARRVPRDYPCRLSVVDCEIIEKNCNLSAIARGPAHTASSGSCLDTLAPVSGEGGSSRNPTSVARATLRHVYTYTHRTR